MSAERCPSCVGDCEGAWVRGYSHLRFLEVARSLRGHLSHLKAEGMPWPERIYLPPDEWAVWDAWLGGKGKIRSYADEQGRRTEIHPAPSDIG